MCQVCSLCLDHNTSTLVELGFEQRTQKRHKNGINKLQDMLKGKGRLH